MMTILWRMNLIGFLLLAFSLPAVAESAQPSMTQQQRFARMDREMNCIQKNLNSSQITWDTVCYMDKASSANTDTQDSQPPEENSQDTRMQDAAARIHQGETQHPELQVNPAPELTKKHSFEFGTEVSYVSYKEHSVGMTEKGPFFGLNGAYNFRPENNPIAPIVNVFHLDTHINYGNVD